jgi:type I restriction enzyme S subunit
VSLTKVVLASLLIDSKPGFASGEDLEEGVFQIRMNNITRDGALDVAKRRRVSVDQKKLDSVSLNVGDVLFNATNSPDLVGKSAFIGNIDEPTTYSNHFVRLRPDPKKLDGSYLARWLHTLFQAGKFRGLCKQWVNQATVSRDSLLALEIPLPPLPEQRRIAAILDQADALRAKRREALAQLDRLTQAIFVEMFGDPVSNPKGWPTSMQLGDVAEIVSGVTKGRNLDGKNTRVVPYLAVANVQDKALSLSNVKEIEATDTEIQRYRLRRNDLLLTEGGDPDKLGRGTLWNDELPECIHQNHVFRVRATHGDVTPCFLNWLIGSERGKKYFLRSAKQTTGIASINMTQLRGFPLFLPPLSLQKEFEKRVGTVGDLTHTAIQSAKQIEVLFESLQHRAFQGEL